MYCEDFFGQAEAENMERYLSHASTHDGDPFALPPQHTLSIDDVKDTSDVSAYTEPNTTSGERLTYPTMIDRQCTIPDVFEALSDSPDIFAPFHTFSDFTTNRNTSYQVSRPHSQSDAGGILPNTSPDVHVPINIDQYANADNSITPTGTTPFQTFLDPPLIWYQRVNGQCFSLQTPKGTHKYTIALVYQPLKKDDPYQHVVGTQKHPTGFNHDPTTDVWSETGSLTIAPSIHVCTRVSGPSFLFQLTFSNGTQFHSRPFVVRSKVPVPNTFRNDALRVLRQLEWSPVLKICFICNNTPLEGHQADCRMWELLRPSQRTRPLSATNSGHTQTPRDARQTHKRLERRQRTQQQSPKRPLKYQAPTA